MTITAEQAAKLLEGTPPGPWRADGPPYNRIVWSSADNRVCFMAHTNGLDDARDNSTSNLVAAAPNLARALIASEAARKLAEERLAKAVEGLSALDKAAGEVARNGAVTGPQWTRLTVALLKARAVLKEIDNG